MSRIIIYPYKFASGSSRRLAEAVRARGYNCLRVHPDRAYTKRPSDVVLNWGSHTVPSWEHSGMLNDIPNVVIAGNKTEALSVMQNAGVPTIEYTTSKQRAQDWLEHDGLVVERHLLNASGGRGIVLTELDPNTGRGKVGDAPLYTRYFKKRREYRVHVGNGEIIDWQQKMNRREETEEVNYKIRNHDNGWIFARDAAEDIPEQLLRFSVQAVNALGLVFGAVDVGWNDHYGSGVVFEVNTAPGLSGDSTLRSYTDFVIDHYEDVN